MSQAAPTHIGRYQIVRSLGEGGMGAVFLARDPAIDRHVAIKLMRTGFDIGQLRERFAREAKSIGRLHHPNIVTIFDVGEHEGEPFIAMEYVEGQTLASVIANAATVPLLDKLSCIDGMFAGLHYAHRAGIIHRDIKPANIMLDADGAVKILDFGIARATTMGLTQAGTQAGTILGTLNYMSPEQLSGKPVDHRTDIFSAGAVFYEILAGRSAFPGDIQTGVLHLILTAGPQPLEQVCPGLDRDVMAVVNKCLARDVEQRYPDLGAARRDLAAARRKVEERGAPEVPIVMPTGGIALHDVPTSRSAGQDTRAELLRLRRERIGEQLTAARAAIAREDFSAARAACQQALIIDPENDEAQALQDQADAVERSRQLMRQAQSELDKGSYTTAASLADQALALSPGLAAALKIREAVAEARRRLDETEKKARAVEDALSRARQHVADANVEQAQAAMTEVIALDRGNAEVASLKPKLESLLSARKQAGEQARIEQAVAQARQRFAKGDRQLAMGALRALPQTPFVREALTALEAELRQINAAAVPVAAVPTVLEQPAHADETIVIRKPAPHLPPTIAEVEAAHRAPAASAPARPRMNMGLMAGIAVAVVAVVAVAWHFLSSSAPVPAGGALSTVRLDVSPWANVESITRADGTLVTFDAGRPTTPCVLSLPPGRYHLRATNPLFKDAHLDADFTVAPGDQALHFTLPGVKAEDLIKEIIKP